jgi:hypothetical protein
MQVVATRAVSLSEAVDDGTANAPKGEGREIGPSVGRIAGRCFGQADLGVATHVVAIDDVVKVELAHDVLREDAGEVEVVCDQLVAREGFHRLPLSGGPAARPGRGNGKVDAGDSRRADSAGMRS